MLPPSKSLSDFKILRESMNTITEPDIHTGSVDSADEVIWISVGSKENFDQVKIRDPSGAFLLECAMANNFETVDDKNDVNRGDFVCIILFHGAPVPGAIDFILGVCMEEPWVYSNAAWQLVRYVTFCSNN